MQRLRKKIERLLPAIVAIALITVVVVVAACQNEYTLYQKNFRIEKVCMTRICIDDFPTEHTELYLLETAISNCPPETLKYDGLARGTPMYSGGSIDTITDIIFMNKGNIIYPIQLHWKNDERNYIPTEITTKHNGNKKNSVLGYNIVDSINASMSLSEDGNKIKYHDVTYLSDIHKLSDWMMEVSSFKFDRCSYDSNYRSFNYLLSFDKTVPDSGYVKFRNRELKILVNNSIKRLKIIGQIRHHCPN